MSLWTLKLTENKKNHTLFKIKTKPIYDIHVILNIFHFMLKRFYWAELTYRAVCLGEKRCCWPCYNQYPLCLERGYIGERPNIVRGLINIWLATDPIIHVSSIGTEWIKVRPVGCKQMICLRCWGWCIGINSTLKRNQPVSAKLQQAFWK